jgi:hypothetical protein
MKFIFLLQTFILTVTVGTLDLYWSGVTDGVQKGYVPTAALHMSDWGEPNDEKVTFRNDRSLAGNHIITYLEPGTAVTISNKKGWACIEAMGYQGFIYTEFHNILE